MSTAPAPLPSGTPTRSLTTLGKAPNPADRQYLVIKVTESAPAAGYFNGETGRTLRSIEVHGVTVRLTDNKDEPLTVYHGARDVQRLTVYADAVEIKGRFALYGCNIEINARKLDGKGGTLITGGLAIEAPLIANTPEATAKAADGQPGGSVTLNIAEQGPPPAIITVGAPAQKVGRHRTHRDLIELLKIDLNDRARRVAAGPYRDQKLALALRDPKFVPGSEAWRRGDLSEDWQYFVWPDLQKVPGYQSALGAITYVEVTLPTPPPGRQWNTGPYTLGRPEGPWTDDKSNYPASGKGGAGGAVASTIPIPDHFRKQTGGASSPSDEGPQQPKTAYHLKMVLGMGHPNPGPASASFESKQKAPPARPAVVAAAEGAFKTIPYTDKKTEGQLRSMCRYAKDCYREGHLVQAGSVLALLPKPATTHSAELRELLAEAALLKSRFEEKRDYYGNPPNWVPLLSLEANVLLFRSEIDRAINMFYLAHLISSRWQAEDDRIQIVSEAINQCYKAIAEHQKTLTKAMSDCGEIEGDLAIVKQQSDDFEKSLGKLREELKKEAKNQADATLAWDQFNSMLNLLEKLASVVPVGQPFLGMGVTAVGDVLATSINPDQSIEQKITGLVQRASAGIKAAAADDKVTTSINSISGDSTAMKELYAQGAELARQKKAIQQQVLSPEDNALKVIKGQIADHEGKIAKETKKRAAELATLTEAASGAADAAGAAVTFAKTFIVDRNEMEARYQKELANIEKGNVRFQGIKAALDQLAQRKEKLLGAALTLERVAAEAAADRMGAVSRLETLTRERERDQKVLNPDVQSFAERLKKDAVDILRKYYYFLLRSWEYYFLEPALEVFDPSDLTQKIQAFLQRNDASVTLSTEQVEQLKQAYKQILSGLGARLVDKLQNEQPRSTTDQEITFKADQLGELNAPIPGPDGPIRRMTVNLEKLGRLPARSDDLRIANIQAEPTISATAGAPLPEKIELRVWHSGTSVIVRKGTRYEFVSSGPDAPVMWGTTHRTRDGENKPIRAADKVIADTLSELFGAKISQIPRYSPSYLGDLELNVFGDPVNAEFTVNQLRLTVTYEYRAVKQ
jgi:hypothetical protein